MEQKTDEEDKHMPVETEDVNWNFEELTKLHSWIYCLALVDFDLSEGQTMRFAYPIDILSFEEKTAISSLSFPDTHTSGKMMGDSYFCFRFRSRLKKSAPLKSTTDVSKRTLLEMQCGNQRTPHPFLFGYVFFRQRKDDTLPRGYFQKSLVIITPLPYVHVFEECVKLVGRYYFKHGVNILDVACRNICEWSAPESSGEVKLPLLGTVITKMIFPHHAPASDSIVSTNPAYADEQDMNHTHSHSHSHSHTHRHNHAHSHTHSAPASKASTPPSKPPPPPPKAQTDAIVNSHESKSTSDLKILSDASICRKGGCFQEINLYKYFHSCLGNLWFLWQLALIGEPILVEAPSAEECSQAVLGIMSLIAPITYQGDFRPYFSIYDEDFKHFCDLHDRGELNKKPLIIGVTNIIFREKAMSKFPNILCLSSTTTTTVYNDSQSPYNDSISELPSSTLSGSHASTDDVIGSNSWVNIDNNVPNNDDFLTILKIKPKTRTAHRAVVKKVNRIDTSTIYKSQIISQSTPSFIPDRDFLSKIVPLPQSEEGVTYEAFEEVCALNNLKLREYFVSLTKRFLRPLEEYCRFRVDGPEWNPYLKPPDLKDILNDRPMDADSGGKVSTADDNHLTEKERFLKHIRKRTGDFPLRLSMLSGLKSGEALVSLYERFLESQNFILWYAPKHARAERLHRRTIDNRIKGMCLACAVKGRPISEGRLMYSKIQQLLHKNNAAPKADKSLNRALISHLRILEKCGVRPSKHDKNVFSAATWYKRLIARDRDKKRNTNPQTNPASSNKLNPNSQQNAHRSHSQPRHQQQPQQPSQEPRIYSTNPQIAQQRRQQNVPNTISGASGTIYDNYRRQQLPPQPRQYQQQPQQPSPNRYTNARNNARLPPFLPTPAADLDYKRIAIPDSGGLPPPSHSRPQNQTQSNSGSNSESSTPQRRRKQKPVHIGSVEHETTSDEISYKGVIHKGRSSRRRNESGGKKPHRFLHVHPNPNDGHQPNPSQ